MDDNTHQVSWNSLKFSSLLVVVHVSYSLQRLYGAGLKLGLSIIVPYLLQVNIIILQVIA